MSKSRLLLAAAIAAPLLQLAAPREAGAVPYESFIDVEDEEDLQDLLAAQQITQDTFDELLDLLQGGVDLNRADRAELYALPNLDYEDVDKILEYRKLQNGRIADPAALVSAGVLTEEKLLAISAFLVLREPGDNPLVAHGWLRLMTRMSYRDRLAPPVALRARVTAMKHLTAGLAATMTRLDVGDVVYDPNRQALLADPRGLRVVAPKAFVRWDDEAMTLVGGSFRAGFGQRLVFDNTRHYTPNGVYADDQLFYSADLTRDCKESTGELPSPCTGAAGDEYVTPDFVWRDGLSGVAGGVKHLDLGDGWLQAYGWGSYARRSIYQYELVDAGRCKDPHDDSDPACAAPDVYVRPPGSLLDPTTRVAYQTLPDVFAEKLFGANVSYFASRRNHVGVTGYGATESDLVGGIDLDFQEWSRLPFGRTFGAVGADFAVGAGWLDVFGEVAQSFDAAPDGLGPARGGGGTAAQLRLTATKRRQELEAVLRYYATDYLNPYARPIAQADVFEGQRARDEAGGRLRYIAHEDRYSLRSAVDVWVSPSSKTPKLDAYVRADVRTTDELRLGLWVRFQDKDLERFGRDQCFEVSTGTDPTGAPIPCSGEQLTTIARARYTPSKDLSLLAMLEHQLVDDNVKHPDEFRQDAAAWLVATYKPAPAWRLRARVRYLNTDLAKNDYLEDSIAALVDAGTILRGHDRLRVRFDAKYWLDQRASTLDRRPNPELTLWLTYEARL